MSGIWFGLGAAVAALAVTGFEYYRLPLAERARHPLYWQLKPGGDLGLLLGIVGASMMTLMLLYSVRKRWHFLRRFGAIQKWLDFHIVLGFYGPLFIVLHSSFKVGGLVSISFWSMLTVMLSGVFGRFIYMQIPRAKSGKELSLREAREREEELAGELVERFGLTDEDLDQVNRAAEGGASARTWLLWLLLRAPFEGLILRARLGRFLFGWQRLRRKALRDFRRVVLRKALAHRRLLLWDRLRRLFHYWHVFHKPFALVMYVLMVVHIAVAWMSGYVSFGGP